MEETNTTKTKELELILKDIEEYIEREYEEDDMVDDTDQMPDGTSFFDGLLGISDRSYLKCYKTTKSNMPFRVDSAPDFSRKKKDDWLKAEMDITFQQQLFRYIDEKGLTEVDAYKRSFVDRRNFSKIRSNKDYTPKKTTAICFCLGLGLDMEESNNLLMKAGYYLSKSSRFDLIIRYAIDNKIYDVLSVNEILYTYGEQNLINTVL